ncbi:UDP-GlcNAc:betaGal beta-1,3-N-acetylglucosaminyltransferase-like protein 1 [Orycteropus afer afer]|uniref:UDP-GlcNAc:betaGal beta-1,3-N-acetylglucosaminyltransferase-like protein 1 n=1 Tax=Orycteropus afer afer TaxID=1230840 RepID=A0A8B7BEU0_ORYAF|nr:UDP-GlcNAc:betaGal beta-1,3-N-acetylglucosaminyltransferase-like protein 1 [Orycteropus afer afer]
MDKQDVVHAYKECYSAIKRREALLCATTWTNPDNIAVDGPAPGRSRPFGSTVCWPLALPAPSRGIDVSLHQSEAAAVPGLPPRHLPPLGKRLRTRTRRRLRRRRLEARAARVGLRGARPAMRALRDPVAAAPVPGGPRAQVSIILPVHNAERWLDECLKSVLQQDFEGTMELSVFNDASQDKSMTIIEKWKVKLEDSGILVVIGGHDSLSPRGVGYSKNRAVAQSSGTYLCFLDSDDVMMPQRVRLQHEAAAQHPRSIIGCQVRRDPPGSTERYTRWINQLSADQLLTQVFTSNGPTVIMPTWFCSRAWFSHIGWFDEGGQGIPEDLLFFQEHLRQGGHVIRVEQSLLLYRYHPQATSLSVLE